MVAPMIAQANADVVDAQIIALLTKTRQSLNVDTTFVAHQTDLTQPIVEGALQRLQTAGWVRVDTEGRWTLV